MAQEDVQTLKVRILVGDDLAQEAVKIAERLHLAAQQFRVFLVVALKRGEPRHRRIERRVHRLVVGCALAPLRLEIDGAKPLDLLTKIDSRRVEFSLDRVHAGGIDLLAHLRAFVIRLERLADFLAVVREIEDERVFLEGMDTVQPRQCLNRLDAGQALVDVHRVQKRLVESSLILLRDQ